MEIDFECIDCKKGVNIEEHELYELYDMNEDIRFIDCPYCCVQQAIEVDITFSFKSVDVDDL